MSKLDELIRELCPDGVQVFRLEEIAHYAKTRIDCKTINEDNYVGVENLLQNKAGKTKATSVPTTGMVIAYQKNDILIGNIRPYLRKVWLADCEGGTNGDVLTVQIEDTEKVLPQFLYDENGNESEWVDVSREELDAFNDEIRRYKKTNKPAKEVIEKYAEEIYQSMRNDLGSNLK